MLAMRLPVKLKLHIFRLNGSYNALDGGLTFQGLQDFTGGFTEILMLGNLQAMKIIKDEDDLFKLMVHAQDQSSFMGSSVKVMKIRIRAYVPFQISKRS
jgi:hypothetical protein